MEHTALSGAVFLYIVVYIDFRTQNGYNTIRKLWISLAGNDYGKARKIRRLQYFHAER